MSETGNNSLFFLHMLDVLAGNLYVRTKAWGGGGGAAIKRYKTLVIIVFILVNEIYVYMGSCVSDLCVHAILCCLSFLDYARDEELLFAPSHFLWVLAISGV